MKKLLSPLFQINPTCKGEDLDILFYEKHSFFVLILQIRFSLKMEMCVSIKDICYYRDPCCMSIIPRKVC